MDSEAEQFPRAIVHVDGDSFFAACEVARNPALKGLPVVTGAERGIVSAATKEAKALGIRRPMPMYEVRQKFPTVIVLPADYEMYTLVSKRMYAIARRYTGDVEEYGIDECFADITGSRTLHGMSYEEIARALKDDLGRELGMTFSVGLAPTKVLAKLGSKHRKPDGFTVIPAGEHEAYLKETPIGYVWGIGYRTTEKFEAEGIRTAYAFAMQPEAWVRERFPRPVLDLWHELNARPVNRMKDNDAPHKSIQRTHTFTPPSTDPSFIFSELSKNVEHACHGAREEHLTPKHVSIFLKTQAHRYQTADFSLSVPTTAPHEILQAVRPEFLKLFRPQTLYRASGITLHALRPEDGLQLDLFDKQAKQNDLGALFAGLDRIDAKYGRHTVYLGTSAKALARDRERAPSLTTDIRTQSLMEGEHRGKRLRLPYLGEVT